MTIRKTMAMLKQLGPYAAIELVLPGGSLIAVLLWLYRHTKPIVRTTPAPEVRPAVLSSL